MLNKRNKDSNPFNLKVRLLSRGIRTAGIRLQKPSVNPEGVVDRTVLLRNAPSGYRGRGGKEKKLVGIFEGEESPPSFIVIAVAAPLTRGITNGSRRVRARRQLCLAPLTPFRPYVAFQWAEMKNELQFGVHAHSLTGTTHAATATKARFRGHRQLGRTSAGCRL